MLKQILMMRTRGLSGPLLRSSGVHSFVRSVGNWISLNGGGGGTIVSPEAQAVLDRMDSLSEPERSAIINFVDYLVSQSVWDKIDDFWCFALNNTNDDWLTGFKATNCTLSASAPARTANGASISSSVTSYITIPKNINSFTNHQPADGSMGVFLQAATKPAPSINPFFGVSVGTARAYMSFSGIWGEVRFSGGNGYNGTWSGRSYSDFTGGDVMLMTNSRPNFVDAYINAESSTTPSTAVTLLPAGTPLVGAYKTNGVVTNGMAKTISVAWVGAGSPSGVTYATLNVAIRNLLIDLGVAGVTPA